jgi:hypothetical protein
VTVESTGDTTESIFNGCSVTYTDFAGNPQRLLPTDTSLLRDGASWIAANRWNDQAWFDIELSWKATASDAALIGSIALAEANRAQRPSTIEVPYELMDKHGTKQPCWKVRAGDTISVMDQGSTSPRLITETSWQNGVLRITTDNAVDSLAVVQQRIASALGVGGLS